MAVICSNRLVLVGFLVLGLSGCAATTAEVRGVVTLNDQPLTDAFLEFIPEGEDNKSNTYAGSTNGQGEYTLIAPAQGIRPGRYKVAISRFVQARGKVIPREDVEMAKAAGNARNVIPPNYSDPGKTELRAELKAGLNTCNFQLKKGS